MKNEIMRLAEAMAVAMAGEKDAVALIEARTALEAAVEALTAERDAYAKCADAYEKCADTMAAAHKVERDALKDAAKLALDALENIPTAFGNIAYTKDVQEAIAALKAAL